LSTPQLTDTGVVFQIRISPRIWSQNRNGSKSSARDLGQSDLCKKLGKFGSLPCPFNIALDQSNQYTLKRAVIRLYWYSDFFYKNLVKKNFGFMLSNFLFWYWELWRYWEGVQWLATWSVLLRASPPCPPLIYTVQARTGVPVSRHVISSPQKHQHLYKRINLLAE
jgi:hypothetical protein